MRPWTLDADAFDIDQIPSNFIVRNGKIENFLDLSQTQLFLLGPKGTGKTLLLRYKAYQYSKRIESGSEKTAFVAGGSNELVESLVFNVPVLSNNELIVLSEKREWLKVWKFSLSLIIARRCGLDLIESLETMLSNFPKSYGLSDVVSEILSNVSKYITSDYLDKATKELQASLRQIKGSFAIFIDRLDQALNACLERSEDHYLDDSSGNNYHFLVWRHAQTGLLQSCYEMYTSNRHIKIFCTARKESLDMKYLRENLREYATELEYNYEELKEIFKNNIRLIPKTKIFNGSSKNPFERMFGFVDVPHLHAKDENGKPRIEEIFGLIHRHTFGRPREIVVMGRKIYEDVIDRDNYRSMTSSQQIEKIRRKVDDTAYEILFEDYTNEIVPSFKEEIFEDFIEKVKSNVFTAKQLENIDEEDCNYLFRLGLVGYVKNGVQYFIPAANYVNNQNIKIDLCEFYLVHPAADRRLQRNNLFDEFYNDSNIIGSGYSFEPPSLLAINPDPINIFLPKEIAGGNGMHAANKNQAIFVPLQKLYEGFFGHDQSSRSIQRFKKERLPKTVKTFLSRVADLVVLDSLEKEFGNQFANWRQHIDKQLRLNYNNWHFQTQIKDLSEQSLVYFGQRLVGRMMTIGMYCYLNLCPTQIQNLITGNSRDLVFRPVDNENSIRYLRKSFFIKGLKENGFSNHKTIREGVSKLNPSPEADSVLFYCSDYEQDFLSNWWKDYVFHDLHTNKFLNKDYLQHLEESVL